MLNEESNITIDKMSTHEKKSIWEVIDEFRGKEVTDNCQRVSARELPLIKHKWVVLEHDIIRHSKTVSELALKCHTSIEYKDFEYFEMFYKELCIAVKVFFSQEIQSVNRYLNFDVKQRLENIYDVVDLVKPYVESTRKRCVEYFGKPVSLTGHRHSALYDTWNVRYYIKGYKPAEELLDIAYAVTDLLSMSYKGKFSNPEYIEYLRAYVATYNKIITRLNEYCQYRSDEDGLKLADRLYSKMWDAIKYPDGGDHPFNNTALSAGKYCRADICGQLVFQENQHDSIVAELEQLKKDSTTVSDSMGTSVVANKVNNSIRVKMMVIENLAKLVKQEPANASNYADDILSIVGEVKDLIAN